MFVFLFFDFGKFLLIIIIIITYFEVVFFEFSSWAFFFFGFSMDIYFLKLKISPFWPCFFIVLYIFGIFCIFLVNMFMVGQDVYFYAK